MSALPPIAKRYFAAINGERWPALEALWHPDAELRAVGSRPRRGRADVMSYYSGLFEPWRTHRDEPVRAIVDGGAIIVEVRFDGTTYDGRSVTFDAVDVFDVADPADGPITRLASWYDLVYVRRLLGTAS